MDYERIISELSAQHSPEELKQVALRLLEASKPHRVEFETTEYWVWETVQAVLPESFLTRQSLDTFTKDYGRERFKETAQLVLKFIDNGCGESKPMGLELRALLREVLSCLNGYLEERRAEAADAKQLLNSVAFLKRAVEAAYPGYAEARMLKVLVRRKDGQLDGR